jgi:hypothetical protein
MSEQNEERGASPDSDGDDAATGKFVITAFPPYFESQHRSNWCWIAVAVMIGNYSQTGPLVNGKPSKWTQSGVASACLGSSSVNAIGYPDRSMTQTLVYSPTDTGASQSYGEMRKAIRQKAPVVLGWGSTGRGGQIHNGHVIAIYGYDGASKWYFADPLKSAVTEGAALPIPKDLPNPDMMVWYSRVPSIRMS